MKSPLRRDPTPDVALVLVSYASVMLRNSWATKQAKECGGKKKNKTILQFGQDELQTLCLGSQTVLGVLKYICIFLGPKRPGLAANRKSMTGQSPHESKFKTHASAEGIHT